MMADIATIIWKEFAELFMQRGRFRGGLVGMLIFVGVFGVVMPLQTGREWVETPAGLIFFLWLPYLLVSGVTADTFAGERERHTLETLLASRLSDRSILFGKMGATILYGWGITLLNIALGLVTVNLAFGQGEFLMFPPDLLVAVLVLSLLVTGFGATLGTVVSLRAATVRQASQILSVVMLLVFIPLLLLPLIPPDWQARAMQTLTAMEIRQIGLWAMAILLILDVGLLAFTIQQFQRAKLILD